MKKRVAKAASGDAKNLAPLDSVYFSDMLSLLEHCAVVKYDDGEPRETGWITIKTKGNAWVVQVKDPDGGCSIDVIGETLDKALEDAAKLITCDECPWMTDVFLRARKKPGKK